VADDDRKGGLLALPRGFRERTFVTARLASKLGAAALKKQLGWSGEEGDPREAEARAAELVAQMGKLKGLVMKVGQMASYLPGAMPPAAQRVLSQLQDSTEPMARAVVEEIVERELGEPASTAFESFDATPFAAASIGQVHAAKHAGRDVAVKIQYPGIEEALRGDLRMASFMVSMMSVGTAIDGKALADELATRILEECDYEREARRSATFRSLLEADPVHVVPEVIADRSARRVLTTAKIEGQSFARFSASASQEQKDRAGEIIYDACFRILFGRAAFNADPHPGNYLFLPEGRVAFLDFGCARSFEKPMIDRWKAFARAVVDGDKNAFREGFIAMGFVRPTEKKFDWDAQWDATRFLYRPFLERDFRFEPEYIQKSYDILMFQNPNKMRMGNPPEWLFLNRLQWGLFAVLTELRAKGPWSELWREYIESETNPVALD
jgi:predicted unusual protein kinase regulating ubiquinone biosynthesis (AarF/ABC1/UbiB family)